MNIYLIRHGDAENASASKKDFDRELTVDGIEKIKRAAEGWKKIIPSFDQIITSPLTRAVQTAKIISDVFNHQHTLIVEKRLRAGGSTEDLIEVANYFEDQNIAFVGHQPDFSEHLSALISTSGAYADFKKGMIAKISFYNKVREGKGTLEFLIPAGLFK
jgi:phosphohistidine phosphatase